MSVRQRINAEVSRAQTKYGPFTSTHEALGVLIEEVDELKEAIHANSMKSIEIEAIQVSAVARRLAECCETRSISFEVRSFGK